MKTKEEYDIYVDKMGGIIMSYDTDGYDTWAIIEQPHRPSMTILGRMIGNGGEWVAYVGTFTTELTDTAVFKNAVRHAQRMARFVNEAKEIEKYEQGT